MCPYIVYQTKNGNYHPMNAYIVKETKRAVFILWVPYFEGI